MSGPHKYDAEDALQPTTQQCTWSLGNRYWLVKGQDVPDGKQVLCKWGDRHGKYYFISRSLEVETAAECLNPAGRLVPIHLAGSHGVWDLGDAFLKVLKPSSPQVTREHVTLEQVRRQQWSFPIPSVLFHDEWDGRYYIVVSRIEGETVAKVWPALTETEKDACTARVAEICQEQNKWEGDRIEGVDGGEVCEYYLQPRSDVCVFGHLDLLRSCQDLGMDTACRMGFYHTDMGPTNLIYNKGQIAPIDWECAGWFPKEWVTTKFLVGRGMELEDVEGDGRYEFGTRVSKHLARHGYTNIVKRFKTWRRGM